MKLQLWDTSGQGRFCTIIRSYSRGAQGILLVYDITNKWSFDGIDRWLKEVEEVLYSPDKLDLLLTVNHISFAMFKSQNLSQYLYNKFWQLKVKETFSKFLAQLVLYIYNTKMFLMKNLGQVVLGEKIFS